MRHLLFPFLALFCLASCATSSSPGQAANNALARKSVKTIKARLLALTPIGSTAEHTLQVVRTTLRKPDAKYETNFKEIDPNEPNQFRHIDGQIGVLLGSTPPIFLVSTETIVEWNFDKQGKLKDIEVRKQATGP